MLDKDFKMNRDDLGEETPEERAVAADSAAADTEIARLSGDLQDLKQTLLGAKPTLKTIASASTRNARRIPSAIPRASSKH